MTKKQKQSIAFKKWYQKNKNYFKFWRINNKEKIKKINKKNYDNHKDSRAKYAKKQYFKNQEQRKQYARNYYQINKNEINQKFNTKFIEKRKIDINFRILCNLRKRIWKVLKENSKSKSTINLLGCSVDLLRFHLQNKFQPGMSFSNYGKWHIDHIKPCACFDLSKASEQRKCFHYTNLQPLWAKDNIRKGKKFLTKKEK